VGPYLVGTQCLFDLGLHDGGPVQRWFEAKSAQQGLFADDVVVSAFSVAAVRLHYRRTPPRNAAEATHHGNLDGLIRQFEVANQVVGASPAVVATWTDALAAVLIEYEHADGSRQRCGFEEKLVLATAICGNQGFPFVLIDRKQAVHADLGIVVEDPWQAAVKREA
jgi:hypothetical protein